MENGGRNSESFRFFDFNFVSCRPQLCLKIRHIAHGKSRFIKILVGGIVRAHLKLEICYRLTDTAGGLASRAVHG